jgi:methylenetetrahydromethanopterin dehydrogenase
VSNIVKIGILKLGCIGSAPLIEFLLDERAERRDIEVRVVGSGASMNPRQCKEAAEVLLHFKPDFSIIISPNAAVRGPKVGREILSKAGLPTLIISDSPAKKITQELEANGFGYIVIEADAMIGARREFLDPIEMALFNSDMIRVLAITGVFRVLIEEIDKIINLVKTSEQLILPKIVINNKKASAYSSLVNEYAKVKAMAAHEMAKTVGSINRKGCFVIQEWEKYTETVASAHEMMHNAAKLADEARELEKSGDHVIRYPHHPTGSCLHKKKLIEKPNKPHTEVN